MDTGEWVRRFCDHVCAKFGEESREKAERSARGYLMGASEEEQDPETVAASVIDWWDARGKWNGEEYEAIVYDVVAVFPEKVVLALPGVDWMDAEADLKQVIDPPKDIVVGDQLIVRSDGITNWSRSVRIPVPSSIAEGQP